MSWFRRRKKKDAKAAPGPALTAEAAPPPADSVSLSGLLEGLEVALLGAGQDAKDRELVEARLADAYRDLEQPPMAPEAFAEHAGVLDDDGWARLAALVRLLDDETCRHALPSLLDSGGVASQVREAFIAFAAEAELLTLDVLKESEFRREEFARRWVLRLGAGIEGETVSESLEQLERLDYGALLGAAEKAEQLARERMAYLKKLQDVEDAARAPRGKW